MARFQRLLPSLVMALTLVLGIIGTGIADVAVVRAATATANSIDAAAESYALTGGPTDPISVPGYPY